MTKPITPLRQRMLDDMASPMERHRFEERSGAGHGGTRLALRAERVSSACLKSRTPQAREGR